MRTLGRTMATAMAALVLAALSPLSGHASPVPPTPELWIVAADGSGERVLVETGTEFDWAPDGDRLVVAAGARLSIVDALTGEQTTLTKSFEGASDPKWSPDGSLIAYRYCGDTGCGLAAVAPNDSDNRSLMAPGGHPVGMSWSPDSTRIAFVTGPGNGLPGQLHLLEVDRKSVRPVSTTDAFYTETAWSFDGAWISFLEWKPDNSSGLSIIRPDGTNERSLSDDLDYVASPEWSPTEEEIAFSGSDQDGRSGVYLATPSEPAPRLFVEGATDPTWSPDGEQITYTLGGDLFARPRDGGAERSLTDEDLRDDRAPDWSPEDDWIVFTGTRVQVLCGGFPYPAEANVIGTPGDDVLLGTSNADVIAGRGGNDTINGLEGNDIMCGDDGDDLVDGGPGDDLVYGNRGADGVLGGSGNDEVEGSEGDDSVDGGSGTDLLTFFSGTGAVQVDLELGTAVGHGTDLLNGIENVTGTGKADVLAGDAGRNVLNGAGFFWTQVHDKDELFGRGGRDSLYGFSGADRLRGGTGADRLWGGQGNDDCRGGPGRDSIREC